MSEWKTLSSITSKIGSGSTPRGGNSVYSDSGISFIRSQNVLDMDFSTENLAFINDNQAEKLNNVIVEKNDILLNITGDSIARCTVVPEEILPARVNQHVSIIRCKNTEESKYVMYYLQYMKKYLLQISKVGGTRNALTKEAIGKLPIKISDDSNKISKILDDIDKKIQTNNQINQELEAMAKILYNYWFVQFDFPDQNGKPYKSSGGKMVYNPELKREIPEGWGVEKLDSLLKIGKETTNPKKFPNEEFKYYSIPEFDTTGTYSLERGESIKSNKFKVEKNDLLVSKLNPWFNRVIYNLEENAISSTEFIVWKTFNRFEKNFLYQVATGKEFIEYCTRFATGTSNSHKRVSPDTMIGFQIPFEKTYIQKFGEIIDSIRTQVLQNNEQNRELTRLRDWLLPMLMNGQVKVEKRE